MLTPEQAVKVDRVKSLLNSYFNTQLSDDYLSALCRIMSVEGKDDLIQKISKLCVMSDLTPEQVVQIVSELKGVLHLVASTNLNGMFVLMNLAVQRFRESCGRLTKPIEGENAINHFDNNTASLSTAAARAATATASRSNFFEANVSSSDVSGNRIMDSYVIDKELPSLNSKWRTFKPDNETDHQQEITNLIAENMGLSQQVHVQADEIRRLQDIIAQQRQTIDALKSEINYRASERVSNKQVSNR